MSFERNCGIYIIKNLVTGKVYVGSSSHLAKRKGEHFVLLEKGCHSNIRLQNSYNKHGKSNFIFEVIEHVIVADRDYLVKEREQWYLDNSDHSYNLAKLAWAGQCGPRTKSAIEKMRLTKIGIKQSPETIAKRVALNTGKKRTEETKVKISIANKGKKRSEEVKLKLSIINTGKKLSEETKKKLSLALKGVPKSKEHKLAYSLSKSKTPVLQFTLSGEFVREWLSLTDITMELGIERALIYNSWRDNYRSCGGFIWRRKSEFVKLTKEEKTTSLAAYRVYKENYKAPKLKFAPKPHQWIAVVQLDLNFNFISEFNNIEQASKSTGISKTRICASSKSNLTLKTSGLYYWIRKSDYHTPAIKVAC